MNFANLKQYKELLVKNEDKIILTIGFALVAFLSFGAGKLSESYRPQTPIIFKDSPACQNPPASGSASADIAKTEGKIIGNKNSLIYHIPGGSSYDKISPENRVYFDSEADAQKAGYRKAKN